MDIAALSGVSEVRRSALGKIYGATMGKDGVAAPAQPIGGEGEPAGWATWITGGVPQTTPQGPSLRFAFGTLVGYLFGARSSSLAGLSLTIMSSSRSVKPFLRMFEMNA